MATTQDMKALGRKGSLKGAATANAGRTPEERSAIARMGGLARAASLKGNDHLQWAHDAQAALQAKEADPTPVGDNGVTLGMIAKWERTTKAAATLRARNEVTARAQLVRDGVL